MQNKIVNYSIVAAISVILTAITIYHYPLFNPDGMLYLELAKRYPYAGFMSIFHVYHWPFYSMMLSWGSRLFHLSLLHTVYLSNVVFSTLTVFIFIFIIKELEGSDRFFWLAAFVILIFHTFNSYRGDILREHGYWLFYLVSVWFLLRFIQQLRWRYAMGWSLSMMMAALFRVEGLIFLLAAPFFCIFLSMFSVKSRILAILKLNLLTITGGVGFGMLLFSLHKSFPDIENIPNISSLLDYSVHLSQVVAARVSAMQQYVLPSLGEKNALEIFLFGWMASYCVHVINALSLGYTICVFYAMKYMRTIRLSFSKQLVLFWYLLINVMMTLLYYWKFVYLSGRYMVALALILLCYVPFGLYVLYQRWRATERKFSWAKLFFVLTVFLMFNMAVATVYRFGPSKRYIYNAGVWLHDNTTPSTRIYTNEGRLAFFAERESGGWDSEKKGSLNMDYLAEAPWKGYDYAALVLSYMPPGGQEQLEKVLGKPIKTFDYTRRNDKVLIFKLSEH